MARTITTTIVIIMIVAVVEPTTSCIFGGQIGEARFTPLCKYRVRLVAKMSFLLVAAGCGWMLELKLIKLFSVHVSNELDESRGWRAFKQNNKFARMDGEGSAR